MIRYSYQTSLDTRYCNFQYSGTLLLFVFLFLPGFAVMAKEKAILEILLYQPSKHISGNYNKPPAISPPGPGPGGRPPTILSGGTVSSSGDPGMGGRGGRGRHGENRRNNIGAGGEGDEEDVDTFLDSDLPGISEYDQYKSYKLSGHFSPAGAAMKAEGPIIQVRKSKYMIIFVSGGCEAVCGGYYSSMVREIIDYHQVSHLKGTPERYLWF